MHPMRNLIDITEGVSPTMPPELALDIARRFLGFRTLEMENSDRLDFKEVGKVGVQQALEAAYRAGASKAS